MTQLLALFFLLLPTYLIRFRIGPLPTTFLEIFFWIVFLVQHQKILFSTFSSLFSQHRSLFIAITLFLLAATISVFTSIDTRAALGEWKAFYVEPVILFFILITSIKTKKHVDNILLSLISLSILTSALAIYQHFTGWLVPYAFWANHDTYRVTAWYGFPNGVGLFLAPIIPLAIYRIQQSRTEKTRFIIPILMIPASLLAILFAKSTGGLIGIAAGIGVLLLLCKKTRLPASIVGVVALITLFALPKDNPIRQELLMQDRSGQIRVSMWGEAAELLSDRPILGAGLASYAERVAPYHTTVNGEGIEIFHHPHNIFLTMWVNLGLLGLVGFVWILVWFYKSAINYSRLHTEPPDLVGVATVSLSPYLLASMTTLLVTGLVDSPYIKNDLAMFFWLLPALMIITTKHYETMENT